jgi:hypothetical protein
MSKTKICKYCGASFTPDPRVGDRQKCCGSPYCKAQRKKEADRNWRQKNPNYFKGRYESYLKPWLKKHPGYLKAYRQRKKLQAQNDIQDKILLLKIQRIKHSSPGQKKDIQDELTSIFSTSMFKLNGYVYDIQDEMSLLKAFSYAP